MEKNREVLYEAEVNNLKSSDRVRRIMRTITIFILEILFLLGLSLIFSFTGHPLIFSAIIFIISVLIFIPSPILIVPSKYRVLKNGVDCDGRKLIPIKKGYKSNMNEKRKFVSISHSRRGEIMRLYTNEPKKLLSILQRSVLK